MHKTQKEKIEEILSCLQKENIETYRNEINDTLNYSTSSLERSYKLKGIFEAILNRELVSTDLYSKIKDLTNDIDNSIS